MQIYMMSLLVLVKQTEAGLPLSMLTELEMDKELK